MNERAAPGSVRIGIVAKDALRALGLAAIVEEHAGWSALPLALEELMRAVGLSALLLDAQVIDKPLDLIAKLRRGLPDMAVILFSQPLSLDEVQDVIAAGAKGYLPLNARESEVVMAIEVVLDGSVWAPRKVLARLIEAGGVPAARGRAAQSLSARLTQKELEVLELLMQGGTNRQIAAQMHIEDVTVKAHLGRMLRKAGVKSRVELTLRAMEEKRQDEAFPFWDKPELL
jgi:DNA-binding NarL/FixJ family response regulator